MTLWSALETVPGPAGLLPVWRQLLGGEFPAVEPYLQPRGMLALSIPCLDPRRPHLRYRVVEPEPNRFVGVCHETESRIPLTREELVVYEIDWPRFRHDLARTLELEPFGSPPDGLPPDVQAIGSLRPVAGLAFPAYLVLALESRQLRSAICALASVTDASFLVLAPTRQHLRPDTQRVLEAHRSGFVALDEAVTAPSAGRWARTPVGDQMIPAFLRLHLPSPKTAVSRDLFPTPAGARWSDLHIRFRDGHTVSATIHGLSRVLSYAELGMSDRRNRSPTTQWEFFRDLAWEHGRMTWGSRRASKNNQKRRERLAQHLREFFRIDGEPIELIESGDGWRTVFRLDPES